MYAFCKVPLSTSHKGGSLFRLNGRARSGSYGVSCIVGLSRSHTLLPSFSPLTCRMQQSEICLVFASSQQRSHMGDAKVMYERVSKPSVSAASRCSRIRRKSEFHVANGSAESRQVTMETSR